MICLFTLFSLQALGSLPQPEMAGFQSSAATFFSSPNYSSSLQTPADTAVTHFA